MRCAKSHMIFTRMPVFAGRALDNPDLLALHDGAEGMGGTWWKEWCCFFLVGGAKSYMRWWAGHLTSHRSSTAMDTRKNFLQRSYVESYMIELCKKFGLGDSVHPPSMRRALQADDNPTTCGICLGEVTNIEKVRLLCCCGFGTVHLDCMERWAVDRKWACPQCQQKEENCRVVSYVSRFHSIL